MNMIVWSLLAFVQFLPITPFSFKQASFTFPKYGQRLKGKALKTRYTRSTFFCANDCVRMEGCSAFNYDEKNGTCHLMGTNDLSKAEPSPDYQIVLKKTTCVIQPCFHGGTCHDTPTFVHDDKSYVCSCPCGRCGRRCEKLHFGHVEDACIYLFNAGYKKVESPDECMSFCWDTQGCRSADYISKQGACWLNSVTHDEEPLTIDCDKWYPGVAYLFFNCTCDD